MSELDIDPELYTHTLASIVLKNTKVSLDKLEQGIRKWRDQHLEGGERTLVDILVDLAAVERYKVPTLLKACNYALLRKEDKAFGKRAYHKGQLTKVQLDEALAFQKQLYKALGEVKRIDVVLVDDGYLSADQAKELWAEYNDYKAKKVEKGVIPPPANAIRAAKAVGIPVEEEKPAFARGARDGTPAAKGKPATTMIPAGASDGNGSHSATTGDSEGGEGGVVEATSGDLQRPDDDRIDGAAAATPSTSPLAGEPVKPALSADPGSTTLPPAPPATSPAAADGDVSTPDVQNIDASILDVDDMRPLPGAKPAIDPGDSATDLADLRVANATADSASQPRDAVPADAAIDDDDSDNGSSEYTPSADDEDPRALFQDGLDKIKPSAGAAAAGVAALAVSRGLADSRGGSYHTGDTSEFELDAAIDEMDLTDELRSAADTEAIDTKVARAARDEKRAEDEKRADEQ